MSSADRRVNGHALPAIVERLLAEDSPHLIEQLTLWGWSANRLWVLSFVLCAVVAAVDALARIQAAMDADDRPGFVTWGSGQRGGRRALLAGARHYGVAMMLAIAVALSKRGSIAEEQGQTGQAKAAA